MTPCKYWRDVGSSENGHIGFDPDKPKSWSGLYSACCDGVFTDVPLGSFAVAWIEQLAAEGITGVCGGGSYCPEITVGSKGTNGRFPGANVRITISEFMRH